MQIKVLRTIRDGQPTMGEMLVDDAHFAYTLEPVYRGDVGADPSLKVWGQTAIPCGTYLCTVRFSNHFQRNLVHVENVPEFSEIMVHGGNSAKDTEGCCLIGENTNHLDTVSSCAPVVDKIVELVQSATEPVYVTYSIVETA